MPHETPLEVTTVEAATVEATPLEATPFDWRRPLRVVRLARRVGVTPWEALAWLESVLEDFEAQASLRGESGDGLPWPPDG